MGRLLGIIWMVYALLGGIGLGLSQVVGLGEDGVGMLAGAAVPILTGVLFSLATGLTYWLISRASRSAAPIVIGFIHLVFAAIGTGTYAMGNLARNSGMSDGGSPDFATMGLLYGAGSLAQLIGGVLFIIALIIAISTERRRPSETF